MSIQQLISNKIKQSGPISFAEYMQIALYHPEFGYYSAGLPKFGKQGDFITAPELTPLFGYALANQVYDILQTLESGNILEFGAGSGRLCIDILTQLEVLGHIPEAYYILEVSPMLKHQQQENIQKAIPHLASRVQWLAQWPEKPFDGVLIANEVLDAMPVQRFIQTESELLEGVVTLDEQNNLKEAFLPSEDERLQHYVQSMLPKHLALPYQSEVNLFVEGWVAECFAMLEQGAVLILDYGFPRHEYYHPDRNAGTLMCHYHHQSHTDPLAHPGEEDITAHVDFTQVAESAHDAGFAILGYTNQGSFLMACGLLELLGNLPEDAQKVKETQSVKQLLLESEMGELFKIIALGKQMEPGLKGFMLSDKRQSL